MAVFKPIKNKQSILDNLPIVEGLYLISTDTGKVYIDVNNSERKELEYQYKIKKILIGEWVLNEVDSIDELKPSGVISNGGISKVFYEIIKNPIFINILWFDFEKDSNVIFSDKRFNSISDINAFIASNKIKFNGDLFSIKVYLKQNENITFNMTPYNHMMSRIVGGRYLNSTYSTLGGYQTEESVFPLSHTMVKTLYKNSLGRVLLPIEMEKALYTITKSSKKSGYNPIYHPHSTSYHTFGDCTLETYYYNTITKTFDSFEAFDLSVPVSYDTYCYYVSEDGEGDYIYEEDIDSSTFFDIQSAIKIQKFIVKNKLNQTCVFFRIYPLGFDTFSIKYFKELNPLHEYLIIAKIKSQSSNEHYKLIETLENKFKLLHPDNGDQYNNNNFCRVLPSLLKNALYTARVKKCRSKYMQPEFSFSVADLTTGVITNFSDKFYLETRNVMATLIRSKK